MAKKTFNEVERYVLKSWASSYDLEQTMESVRKKYEVFCQVIIDEFLKSHPGFYCPRRRISHISGNQSGTICIAKKSWPKEGTGPWASSCGIWIENIRLEYLVDEDELPPMVSIWLTPLRKRSEELLEKAKAKIAAIAPKKLPDKLLSKSIESLPDDGYAIAYELSSKADYLEALQSADLRPLTDLIKQGLESMLVLAPTIDEIVAEKK